MNKLTNLLSVVSMLFVLIGGVSCGDDKDEDINRISPVDKFNLEGDGGLLEIPMERADWSISGVYTPDGSTMWGENNVPLKLDSLGTISFRWFTITRDEGSKLKVNLAPNLDELNGRGFVIALEDGIYNERITVNQGIPDAYEFVKIEYSIEAGDGDSTYISGDNFTAITNSNYSGQEASMVIYPYQNAINTVCFESSEDAAFKWMGKDSVFVRVPSLIVDNSVSLGEEQYYGPDIFNLKPGNMDVKDKITIPPHSCVKVSGEFTYRRRVVTYVLTILNKRTKTENQIKGKWVEVLAQSYKLYIKAEPLNEDPK